MASATSIADRDSLKPDGATRMRSGAYNIGNTPLKWDEFLQVEIQAKRWPDEPGEEAHDDEMNRK